MRITKQQLNQIIKEEISKVLSEAGGVDDPSSWGRPQDLSSVARDQYGLERASDIVNVASYMCI